MTSLTPMPEFPPAPGPAAGTVTPQSPSLGTPAYHTPYSDLIGPSSRSAMTPAPPLPDYGAVYSDPAQPQQYYAPPAYAPPAQTYAAPQPVYAAPTEPGALLPTPQPQPAATAGNRGGAGWTMGEDFR